MLADDYAQLETELGRDPNWAECWVCISDIRLTTDTTESEPELERLSRGRAQRLSVDGKRIAYLALPGEQTGKLRRYIELSGTGHLAEVFTTVEEAYAWLGLQ